jgi:hypothetical protein
MPALQEHEGQTADYALPGRHLQERLMAGTAVEWTIVKPFYPDDLREEEDEK